jgi:CheY-like chemotaxis protein
MGIGIWAMHYIGMLAFRLPVIIWYDWPTVALSLLCAALASAVALFVVSRQQMKLRHALLGSGHEALAALEREHFDLVLMDVQMPEMGGLEATAAIRKKEESTGGHIPIVAMTAGAMQGDQDLCLLAGMDDYLSKPVRARELIEKVEARVALSLKLK